MEPELDALHPFDQKVVDQWLKPGTDVHRGGCWRGARRAGDEEKRKGREQGTEADRTMGGD